MFKNINYLKNEKLSKYSTIKIGGEAKYIVFPQTIKEVKQVVNEVQEKRLKMFVIGNGSNTLFDDKGFDGVVLCLKNLNKVVVKRNKVRAEAGTNLFALNNKLKEFGLSGMEWSFGIPGSVGGFVVMNGGCFGHEICEFIDEVEVLQEGKIRTLKKEDIRFGYRKSSINGVVLAVTISLKKEDPQNVYENMQEALNKKRGAQPCEFPSLGSVFKHVELDGETIYPAKLIDTLGLKGVKIGGVEVSTKHAGFIVNVDLGTGEDYRRLVKFLKEKLAQMGVDVETEVVFVDF